MPYTAATTLEIENRPRAVPGRTGIWSRSTPSCREELLAREVFDALLEAKVLAARRRRHYNQVRPHSSPGYRPPAPKAVSPRQQSPEAASMYAAGLNP